jgi:DNA-directed RNA polymerase specialized sigma24 family protein
MTVMVSDSDIETLVTAVIDGDELAWQRLWKALEPMLLRMLAQPQVFGRLSQREDDRRDVVVSVMARLRADDFHRLRLYGEAKRANADLRFTTWLRVVAKRVGIDHIRAHPEWVRRSEPDASAPGRWVAPETLPPPSRIGGARPAMTNHQAAREVIEQARGAVDETQLRALELWSAGESFEDIAATIDLADAGQAQKIVRAAIERVRRRCRAG